MVSKIGRLSAEVVNRNPNRWSKTFSINVARKMAGRKKIYRLPNGLYVWRK